MALPYPGLIPHVRKVAVNIPRIARAAGFQAKVTSAFRSHAKQKKLYALFLQGKMPYLVAKPGTSPHEKGIALDITSTNTKALVAIMKKFGFTWAGKRDPVHFSLGRLLETGKKKKKSTIISKALGLASWVPGPIGAVGKIGSALGIK